MCAAVDMLASHGYYCPHSPPAGFLADYGPPLARRPSPNLLRGRSAPCLAPQLKTVQLSLDRKPRPILLRAAEPDKTKKKVVFADDRGLALEQVRFMTEPSHVPPYWTLRVVTANGVTTHDPKPAAAPTQHGDRWECRFAQPASDYVGFRRRITEENVSLENVIVKESEGVIEGTVKVKNLDFGKEVYVRATADGWSSHEDTHCAFTESGPIGGASAVSLYDTFSFRLQLPIHSRRLEFCVCFCCKGEEFWDSNRGVNYVVEQRSVRAAPASICGRVNSGNSWSSKSDSAENTPYW